MLQTRSIFIFDIIIKANENMLAFKELTGPTRVASLEPKAYTGIQLAAELAKSMNISGNQTYSVNYSKVTRKLSIVSASSFTILVNTSPFIGSSIHEVLKLGSTDLSGSSIETGSIGKEYKPQMPLLDFVDGENNQRAIDSTINETSGGQVEVIRYGIKKIFEMNIDFVTETNQSGFIERNLNAVTELRYFMEYLVTKSVVEFIQNRDDIENSVTLILETTQESSNGVGFKIKEKQGLVGYFTTGIMTFRKV